MLEFLIPFTLFGNAIVFAGCLLMVFTLLIASEVHETFSGSVATVLVFLALNAWWGTMPVMKYITWQNALLYLIIGFIYSLIRTYAKGTELNKSPNDKKYFRLKDHVFRWWFWFPISLITWVFSDLFRDLFDFVYLKLSKIYEGIFNT